MIGSEDPADEAACPALCTRTAPIRITTVSGTTTGRQRRRVDLQALDGTEHRDRRRDRAVAIEQRRADQTKHQQSPARHVPAWHCRALQQRQQGDDAALAAVVGAQDEKRVLDRDDEDQRPQDQRHHAEDGVIRQRSAMGVGASPTRQPLQPEATGAVMEVTKWLKPSDSVSRIGDSASVQAVTRVNAEQASKRTMRRPTRRPFRGRLIRLG